ncbi:hypothetical protein Nepgr_024128 [Nepenthes gracilis]|uniref:Uncharacterized protein n=1 Tax=Nepenthes gracilis TaxID=150966 RepID=A0AAD3T3S1_NEPGR|nr:hypothetical protein Nepgr_024128 [Nepenthes gracilis]
MNSYRNDYMNILSESHLRCLALRNIGLPTTFQGHPSHNFSKLSEPENLKKKKPVELHRTLSNPMFAHTYGRKDGKSKDHFDAQKPTLQPNQPIIASNRNRFRISKEGATKGRRMKERVETLSERKHQERGTNSRSTGK